MGVFRRGRWGTQVKKGELQKEAVAGTASGGEREEGPRKRLEHFRRKDATSIVPWKETLEGTASGNVTKAKPPP